MSVLSEREALIRETHRVNLNLKLVEDEISLLQPMLKKYESAHAHPATRAKLPETVSTVSLAEKSKIIKSDTSKLKIKERELNVLNNRANTLFADMETKVALRESLFSEIEGMTKEMNTLRIERCGSEDHAAKVKNSGVKDSGHISSTTKSLIDVFMSKMSILETRKKEENMLMEDIALKKERIKTLSALHERNLNEMKLKEEEISVKKLKLEETKKAIASRQEYILSVTKEEGSMLDTLTSSITESEMLKKKLAQLSQQEVELQSREADATQTEEEMKTKIADLKNRKEELKKKREDIIKINEDQLRSFKDRTGPLIDSLTSQKESLNAQMEKHKRRIADRNECLALKKELEDYGYVQIVNGTEIDEIKKEIKDSRDQIKKYVEDCERYNEGTDACNTEADNLLASSRLIKEGELAKLKEKDEAANQYESEILKMKELIEKRREHATRMEQESQRLLEKGKKDKERKEQEKKDKEMKKKMEIEEKKEAEKREKAKAKKMKEEREKMEKEEKEKKMKEEKERKMKEERDNKIKKMNEMEMNKSNTLFGSQMPQQIQARREEMEKNNSQYHRNNSPSIVNARFPYTANIPSQSTHNNKFSIFGNGESSDDEEDVEDENDFIFTMRSLPDVPEKYADSPPRGVDHPRMAQQSAEDSFNVLQCSTPKRNKSGNDDPKASLPVSQNKKAARGRGGKRGRGK